MKKSIILLLLFMLLPMVARAHDFCVDGVYYRVLNENEVAVTWCGETYNTYYNEYPGVVVIPETVINDGAIYSVRSIDIDAFRNCSLRSIEIPNTVTAIGKRAFYNCSSLSTIEIPNSVSSISDSMLQNCISLSSVVIGDSVISIGNNAFINCYNLTEVNIPNSVISIGNNAFKGCTGITSAVIGNSVLTIGNSVFNGCSEMENIIIGNSVISIGDSTFNGCTKLMDIEIPNSVTTIGYNVFNETPWFNNQPDGLVYAGLVAYKFKGEMPEGTTIVLKDGTLGIAGGAFAGCVGLKNIIIPESVSSLGSRAFSGCSSLTSIDIPDSVPIIGHSTFCNCKSLTNVIIPNSVVEIGDFAFQNCDGMKSVTLGESVRSIGEYAFSFCDSLMGELTIPNSVIEISDYAFSECRKLRSVYFGNAVNYIGKYAFDFTGLTSVDIPSSVTYIDQSAFRCCYELISVTVGNSNTSINNTGTSIGFEAFYGCRGLKIVTLGNSVSSISDKNFSWGGYHSLVLCGNNINYIGVNSFLNTSAVYLLRDLSILPNGNISYPSYVCSFALTPPSGQVTTFGSISNLHVPATSLAAYFTAPYWSNSTNIIGDAIEPDSIAISHESLEMRLGDDAITLNATIYPVNALPSSAIWYSSNPEIVTVNDGKLTAIGVGECDIVAQCLDKKTKCHVMVNDTTVTITLDQQEAKVLPNHIITLTPIAFPVMPNLSVSSSDPSIASARISNGKIQVVGIKEGTVTITVGSVDGTAIPATCIVTVYTEPGDLNCDGFVNISDVTSLIDYLLSGDDFQISIRNADVDGDEIINISDVTELIDYLLNGGFWPWEYETFNVNGVKFTMVRVKGGTFMMGATSEQGNDALENEYPIHRVTLSDYMIGQTEVTQQLWVAVMGSNPSRFGGHMDRPVENVSWENCRSFILKLNQLTGMTFRLPTEAEWEFAARGGNRSSGYKYSGSNDFDEVAWCDVSGSDWLNPKYGTHTAASLKPNELRLYDMSGNVFEWCQDNYGTYSPEDQINPTGAESGAGVWRGGAWDASASRSRVSSRQPNSASFYVGLRLAL